MATEVVSIVVQDRDTNESTPFAPTFENGINVGGGGTGTGTTPVTNTPTGIPLNVTFVTGTSGNEVWCDVSWSPPSNGAAADYEIELRLQDPLDLTPKRFRTGTTSIRLAPLLASTDYKFRLRGINNLGNPGPFTNYFLFNSGKDEQPPAQVVGLIATIGVKTVLVRWTPVTDADVIWGAGTYEVQIATNEGFTADFRTQQTNGTIISFGDLQASIPYYVRVRAVDSSGNFGPFSGTVTAMPDPLIADIPNGSITETKIADDSISTPKLRANAVAADKIAANAIFGFHINAGQITADKVATAAIEADKIAANVIDGTKITSIELEVGKTIKSVNYSFGSAGWIIHGNGNSEFNNILLRGSLFSPDIYNANIRDFSGNSIITFGNLSISLATPVQFNCFAGSNFYGSIAVAQGMGVLGGSAPDIGTPSARWNALYSNLVNATVIQGVQMNLLSGATAASFHFNNGSMFIESSNGNVGFHYNFGAYGNFYAILQNQSTEKAKRRIRPLEMDVMAIVREVKPKRFKWRADDSDDIGLIREELPDEICKGDSYSVGGVLGLLWQGLRELDGRIDALEAR